jgi:hypothetical protein
MKAVGHLEADLHGPGFCKDSGADARPRRLGGKGLARGRKNRQKRQANEGKYFLFHGASMVAKMRLQVNEANASNE